MRLTRMKIRRYSDLVVLNSFEDRFRYLSLEDEFSNYDPFSLYSRKIKQSLYHSKEWRDVRSAVIVRDRCCDLGIAERPIVGPIYVHHMNPINQEMFGIDSLNEFLLDPEFLICVSKETHEAIHHGSEELLPKDVADRYPNDTCPWKDQNRIRF